MMLGREFSALVLLLSTLAMSARADTVVASRTIRAQSIIMPGDIQLIAGDMPGMFISLDEVVGLEARVAIYSGRPIQPADTGPPAIVERNQIVVIVYQSGTLSISAEGRSLGRGGVGDTIRVMNLSSRSTLSGFVAADGSIRVYSGS